MADKTLNLFDECAAKCVQWCPQNKECTWYHSKFTEDAKLNKQKMVLLPK